MRYLFSIAALLLLCCRVWAQEVVYFKNDTRQAGKVSAITGDAVSFTPSEPPGAPEKKVVRNEVLAVFNHRGDYLILEGGKYDETAVNTFLNPPNERRYADVIIARNGKTVVCQITGEDMDKFNYEAKGGVGYKVPKAEVAAVIRKDGRHEVFGPISNILSTLKTAEPDIKMAMVTARELETERMRNGGRDSLNPNSLEAAVSRGEINLDLNLYKRKALQKVEDLGRYIRKIADKKTEMNEANRTVDLACGLFLDEDRVVEVSQSNTEQKARYKIRSYLNKLKAVKYDNVSVSWHNISYVSNFRKGPDGNYYGTISFDQVFEATNEGNILYRDLTRKNVEVIDRKSVV